MVKQRFFLLLFLVLSVVFPLLLQAMGDLEQSRSGQVERFQITDFVLPDLEGERFSFATLSGKVVIVNFWATWCPVCRDEIPHLMDLRNSYASQGFEVLGVSLDEYGALAAKPYAKKMKIDYPIVIGDGEVVKLFGGILGLPTTFVVDRQGFVVARFIGYAGKKALEETIKQYL